MFYILFNANKYVNALRKAIFNTVNNSNKFFDIKESICHYNGYISSGTYKKKIYETKNDVEYAVGIYYYRLISNKTIYNGLNSFYLKKLPKQDYGVYIIQVNETEKQIKANTNERVKQIFGTIFNCSEIFFPYKYKNEYINNKIYFLSSAEDVINLLKDKTIRNKVFTVLKENFNMNILPEILADYSINNNLSSEKSLQKLRKELTYLLTNTIDLAINNMMLNGIDVNDKFTICLKMNTKQISESIIKNKTWLKELDLISSIPLEINDELEQKINAIRIDKYDDIPALAIGQSVPFNGKYFWWNLSHDTSYIPVIYINGNVITSKLGEISPEWGYGRVHHRELFDAYFKQMSLHKNDIIVQTEEEWNKCDGFDWDTIRKYNGVRGVIKNGICTLIDAATPQGAINSGLEEQASQAIKAKENCQVLSISTDAAYISRYAQNNKGIRPGTRLMRKI